MDDVIRIHLDRKLVDKRVFPAISARLSPVEAMELLIDKLNKTKSNAEFLAAMQKMG
jgi:transcription termination factor Rho